LACRTDWEKDPNLQSAYNPVLERSRFPVEKGLTLMMVLHDYLSKHIAPLQECARSTWMYTVVNDTMRLERGDRSNMDAEALATVLSKVSTNLSSTDFITNLVHCLLIYMN
jgi:hypothetical protein